MSSAQHRAGRVELEAVGGLGFIQGVVSGSAFCNHPCTAVFCGPRTWFLVWMTDSQALVPTHLPSGSPTPPLSTVCADHPPQIQPKPLPQGHTTPAICSPPSLPHLQSHARPLPVTCSAQRPGSLQPSTPPVDESATSSGPAMVSAHCLSLPHFHVGGAPAVDTFTLWGYSAIWASSSLALRLCLLHQQGAAHKSISAEH